MSRKKDTEKKHRQRTLRGEIFATFLVLVGGMVLANLILNSIFLEKYYISRKSNAMVAAYNSLNEASNNGDFTSEEFDIEFRKICEKYNISMVVLDSDSQTIKSSSYDTDFLARRLWENVLGESMGIGINGSYVTSPNEVLVEEENYTQQIGVDPVTSTEYMEEWGFLDSGYAFLMRSALDGIKDSAQISNRFAAYIGIVIAIVAAALSIYLSKRITKPVTELSEISDKMKQLDFETKYESKGRDELDRLGENINELSETLEVTISELKTANNELKHDIEQKEEIDRMRVEFISNVSHELKTPIALIQGYAEGLQEGMGEDPESRDYYCGVIVDEASKMNAMVKKLLTLNQLESGGETVSMQRFDLAELIAGYMKSAEILAEQKEVTLHVPSTDPVYVWGDEFMVEEVLQNFYSNAIHHVDGDKVIEIKITPMEDKVRVSVFNTGTPIPEDSIGHIWEKFYKVDKARTREYGGSGVGLSIVKAIMDAMHQEYGVINYDNGVEFWFELATK